MTASAILLSLASLTAAPQDVLYDFYGTSCPPCQRMMPTIEKLREEGFPIVKINAEERPDLAEQFGVNRWPTLILVVGGIERQRVTGWQPEANIRALLAQIPRQSPRLAPTRPSVPVRLVDDGDKGSGWNFHLPLPPFPGKKDNVVQIEPASTTGANAGSKLRGVRVERDPIAAADRPKQRPAESSAEPSDETASTESPPQAGIPRMLASSVRIRVKDQSGVFFGSGVAIDSREGKTIVLTCGHILRDAQRDSRIEVDMFHGKSSRTYRGTIIKFDLESDVGLIAIATPNAITCSPVVSAADGVREGDGAISIGCNGGELPTVEKHRVTRLNRYLGPDTIECTRVPVQGRSGGGLFTADGRVVGVCTNADPRESCGVYAGLGPIHDLLRSAGLDRLVPAGSKGEHEAAAEAPVDRPERTEQPNAEPRSNRREEAVAEASTESPRHPVRHRESAPESTQNVAQNAASKEEEAVTKASEDAEVICIIKPSRGPSRVVIINKASRKFMADLSGETKGQLLPTMGAVTAAEEPIEQQIAAEEFGETSARRNSSWKPTGRFVPTRHADLFVPSAERVTKADWPESAFESPRGK